MPRKIVEHAFLLLYKLMVFVGLIVLLLLHLSMEMKKPSLAAGASLELALVRKILEKQRKVRKSKEKP